MASTPLRNPKILECGGLTPLSPTAKRQFTFLLPCCSFLVFFLASTAFAQYTVWDVQSGNWSINSNWSNGEPTSSYDTYFRNGGTAVINSLGEQCRIFFLGDTISGSGAVSMSTGSLSTAYSLQIGSHAGKGTFEQSGGEVTVGTDLSVSRYHSWGDPSGKYNLHGGTLILKRRVTFNNKISIGELGIGVFNLGNSCRTGTVIETGLLAEQYAP